MESPNDLIRIAENGGKAELYRWLKSRIADVRTQPDLIESIYLDIRQQSPGVALMFAYLLPKELTPEIAEQDIARERSSNPGLWVVGIANILSVHLLDRARFALDSGDILFGLQRHYCAGAGPTALIFPSFSILEAHLRSARPGDEFMLLSVRQCSERGILLRPQLSEVMQFVTSNPMEEVFLLRAEPAPGRVEVIWKGREEEEDISPLFQLSEGLIAVPFIWEQEFFLDAKMPNEKGAVPIGGSY